MPARKIEWIEYTSRYTRSFKKLPRGIQKKTREREAMFTANAFDPRIKTHKLHGMFQDYWAYSVDNKYRVIFRFISGSEALFFDIGLHPIYGGSE
ncbi:MAG: type II toxin-antitoxin system mRNA interferase toxin, RelE/StbE family [Patescibacteria group bacterium]